MEMGHWFKTFGESANNNPYRLLTITFSTVTFSYKVVQALIHYFQSVDWEGAIMDIHSWVTAIVLGLLASAILVIHWLLKYATTLRREKEPKLAIGQIKEDITRQTISPSGRCSRMFSIEIKNISTTLVSRVQVKQVALINAHNEPSQTDGQRFRLHTERGRVLQDEHTQKFDIHPNDNECVDIICINEQDGIDNNVIMLYASPRNGTTVPNSYPQTDFPFFLTVSISAENTAIPLQKNYKLYFTREGFLRMEEADG